MGNVFERTALFQRVGELEGIESIKRIPWDLISMEGSGFMVSPMPMQNLFAETYEEDGTTVKPSLENYDMLVDDALDNSVDNVVRFEFFTSEAEFTSKFENTFGFYQTDNVSGEFGYPLDSGI